MQLFELKFLIFNFINHIFRAKSLGILRICFLELKATICYQIFGMCMERRVHGASTGAQLCGKVQAETDRQQLAASAAAAAATMQRDNHCNNNYNYNQSNNSNSIQHMHLCFLEVVHWLQGLQLALCSALHTILA